MKKIACTTLLFMALVCAANAYIINFEVPSQVNLGDTIIIDGTSTINPGTTMTIVLYSQKNTIQEIERKSFTIQSDGSWSVNFDTDGLAEGNYKFEIPATSDVSLGSSSTTYAMFKIVDRTGEIIISSPLTQDYNEYLLVAGRSTTRGNLGIEIMVDNGEDVIFPEEWISTNSNGEFNKNVPISKPGTYYVSFYDNQGFIRHQEFESVKTGSSTTSVTAVPTSTTTTGKTMSAQSFASYSSPAYFSISTYPGTLTVETSEGHNWIMVYSDEKNTIKTVNQNSNSESESFGISVAGGTVYVKIYPAETSDSGYVTLFTTGASSITVSEDASAFFESQSEPVSTQSGTLFPIGVVSCLIASLVLTLFLRRQ